ncbi:outer membrane beta-barrel protein [Helicobacter sp. 23-1045]
MKRFFKIHKICGVVAICALLSSAYSAEWHTPLEKKEGGFVGAEFGFAPTFDIGAIGGYQWYFYDKPYFHLGMRLAGHFKYLYYQDNRKYAKGKIHFLTLGISPQFIWDFLNIDSHTLGVHFAPLGFNIQARFYENTTSATSSWNMFIAAYEFSIGLHYYIDISHQLYLTFRFGGVGDLGKETKEIANVEKGWGAGISYINLGYAYKF